MLVCTAHATTILHGEPIMDTRPYTQRGSIYSDPTSTFLATQHQIGCGAFNRSTGFASTVIFRLAVDWRLRRTRMTWLKAWTSPKDDSTTASKVSLFAG